MAVRPADRLARGGLCAHPGDPLVRAGDRRIFRRQFRARVRMSKPVRIVVAGAAGRMGQTLIRAIAESDGLKLAGAVEASGGNCLGHDAGALAGRGAIGVPVSDNAESTLTNAD